MPELQHKIADGLDSAECFTIDEIASELGLGKQRARQMIDKAIKSRLTQNVTKKDGARILFAPTMAKQVIEAYHSGKLGRHKKSGDKVSTASLKHAALVLTVPVFDKQKAHILKTQFESDKEIVKYLQDRLDDVAKPALSELEQLEREFEERRNKLLKKNNHLKL